jgi:hypothetical protein
MSAQPGKGETAGPVPAAGGEVSISVREPVSVAGKFVSKWARRGPNSHGATEPNQPASLDLGAPQAVRYARSECNGLEITQTGEANRVRTVQTTCGMPLASDAADHASAVHDEGRLAAFNTIGLVGAEPEEAFDWLAWLAPTVLGLRRRWYRSCRHLRADRAPSHGTPRGVPQPSRFTSGACPLGPAATAATRCDFDRVVPIWGCRRDSGDPAGRGRD